MNTFESAASDNKANHFPCAKTRRFKTLQERFDDNWIPEPNSGCWLWIGKVDRCGYGTTGSGKRHKKLYAHRLSYQLHKGEIDKLCVLHCCDTPACVNPDHLFPGTHADNVKDRCIKNRNAKGQRVPCAKLNPQLVRQIRNLAGTISDTEIARRFNIKSKTTIRRAIDRINWKHVS